MTKNLEIVSSVWCLQIRYSGKVAVWRWGKTLQVLTTLHHPCIAFLVVLANLIPAVHLHGWLRVLLDCQWRHAVPDACLLLLLLPVSNLAILRSNGMRRNGRTSERPQKGRK